jgi:predicted ester cyclase
MSDLERFADEWEASFNAHDADRVGAQWAENGVFEAPGELHIEGREGVVAYAQTWLDAFPDARITTRQRIIQDPWLVNLFTLEGTHKGSLQGPAGEIAATGRRVAGRGTEALRVENGLAVEGHLYFDQVQVMTQLGLMPEPATA